MLSRKSKNIDVKYLNPLAYTVGAEIGANTIVSKVYYKNANYVIFGIRDNKGIDSMSIEYLTVNDDKFNTYAISVQLNRVNFLMGGSHANCDNYNETIADAIALCFRAKEEEAKMVMAQLESEVKNEVFKWSKLIYLQAYLLFAFITILGIWLVKPDNDLLFKTIALGILGGLFSIALKIDDYHVEIKNYKNPAKTIFAPYLVGVIVRFTVACIGAATTFIFIKSEILVIPSLSGQSEHYVMYALGLLSGFSQNFIPSLLTKFETNINAGEPVRMKLSAEKPLQQTLAHLVKVPVVAVETTLPTEEETLLSDDAVG